MIAPEQIKSALEPILQERELILAEVEINKFDDITLTIDKPKGSVSMDDCVAVNRRFIELFDQDEEDYSLTVTSPGVKDPDMDGIDDAELE